MNLFDASYEFPPRNSFQNRRMVTNQTYIYSYTELLYNSYNFNDSCLNNTNFHLFRGAMLEWDNCPRINFCVDFYNYSPQQFYIFNKIIVEWTRKHYKKPYRFIFINAWNEWGEGSYLEPDVNYGYSSINSLSRAIFNISYVQNVYNNIYNFRIAVIAYISNEDSILEIINKIFNIHYEFDLYIFSCVKLNFEKFIPHIKKNSNINAFEIKLVLNRKESLLSYLIDFKTKSRNYKYICNLNVVKYNNISYYEELKNYLLSNLLGDSKIITEIISNFEKNNNLGLIFPEKYIKSQIQFHDFINIFDMNYINCILRRIFSKEVKISIARSFIDFPEGNMFWSKVGAIYQIFNLYSQKALTRKMKLIINNNLEKIWIFLIKFNGFFYKKIFKYL